MARIRSLHPGVNTDETFAALDHASWRLWACLLMECDDQGVFAWKPVTLKMRIFPAHNVDVATLLGDLEDAGVICRFTEGGREYGAVRNFRKFQRPRKPQAVHPMPDQVRTYVGLSDASTEPDDDEGGGGTDPDVVEADPVPQKSGMSPQMEDGGGKREEGRGRKKGSLAVAREPRAPPRSGRGSRLPDDFEPDPGVGLAEGLGLPATMREVAKFCDYWRSAPGQRGVKADWPATWRNWCRKAAEDRKHGPNPGSTTNSGNTGKRPAAGAHDALLGAVARRFAPVPADGRPGQADAPGEPPAGPAEDDPGPRLDLGPDAFRRH